MALDRCIRTVFAAVIALRDCGESDDDIILALKAIQKYGPREALNRFDKQEDAELVN